MSWVSLSQYLVHDMGLLPRLFMWVVVKSSLFNVVDQ